mmetsp:Transcript_129402/g.237958  ORF Transcript_129402/g.237958 Transcript_129402/m.237958 type:complete len:214 (-) Transcript_129402:246-887(-)
MDAVLVAQVILPSGEPVKFDRWGVETAGDLRNRVLRSSADKFVKVFLILPDGCKLEDHVPVKLDAGEGAISVTAVFARLLLHEAIEAAESMLTVDSFDIPNEACRQAGSRPSFGETEPHWDSFDRQSWATPEARSEANSLECEPTLEFEPDSRKDAAPDRICKASELRFVSAPEAESCPVCQGSGNQGVLCRPGLGLWTKPCSQCLGKGFVLQ